MKKDEIPVFYIQDAPYSTDPIDFDAITHHVVMASVLGTLVSTYEAGKQTPFLAEDWKVSDDFKIWIFKIRDNIYFENGDKITPDIIKQAWTRLIYLFRQKKSEANIFDLLEGYNEVNTLQSNISGIKTDHNSITLRFTKPIKDLINILTFGIFAVINPKDYDSRTGAWKDPFKVISSSSYRITEWNKKNKLLTLSLRDDFLPELRHKNAFKIINLVWDEQYANSEYRKQNTDFFIGTIDNKIYSSTHDFYGSGTGSIYYMNLLSWPIPNSPFYEENIRLTFRKEFYELLEKNGYKPIKSFFPLALKDIMEHKDKIHEENNAILKILKGKTIRYKIPPQNNELLDAIRKALDIMSKKYRFNLILNEKYSLEQLVKELNPNLKKYEIDMFLMDTSLSIESPRDDIKFMFLSTEGIRLPDPNNKAKSLLKSDNFDIQKVNECILNNGIIWPIKHSISGMWVKKDKFDLSRLNMLNHPIQFQWVGYK